MSVGADAAVPRSARVLPLTTDAGVAWTFRPSAAPSHQSPGDELPLPAMPGESAATVPGLVHTDLLALGAIPDPFLGTAEDELSWIGRTAWTYTGRFTWTADDHVRHDLVADGLDTIAELSLNGMRIGQARNQHCSHRFEVSHALREGDNELVIRFEAPVTAADRMSAQLGPRPHVNHHPYNAIRKMAANYGWDWGPDLATAGIWKPLGIHAWSGVRIAAVRPLATVNHDGSGTLSAHLELEWSEAAPDQVRDRGPVRARFLVGGIEQVREIRPGQQRAIVELVLDDVQLWWPRGYGRQPLYDVRVVVGVGSVEVDHWQGRVGFRTVRLDTAPDADGHPFVLSVNGADIYVRGVNWIPGDALITRMTAARYEQAIRDAVEANLNLLRVWGGGIYESEDFYRLCDEWGILVWQDFALACAAYAEEEPLRSEIEAEAREAITRLSSHACLAVWNGGNESLLGHADWNWRPALGDLSWGQGYYHELLPRLVDELDPRTPYTPGSPFSVTPDRHPNDPASGTVHIWDVWNTRDYNAYRRYRARFVAEFGFQGPAAWSTLARALDGGDLDPDGQLLSLRQKAEDGNGKLTRGLEGHLPRWRNTDEWHWSTQLNQARAVSFGIEHFRSLWPLNRGLVIWQLNDCWPAISWAAVDSAGIRKPLWHAVRRTCADRLLTLQPREDGIALFAHNDSGDPWVGEVYVRRMANTGATVFAEQAVTLAVAPRELAVLPLAAELLDVGEGTATQFLLARVARSGDPAPPPADGHPTPPTDAVAPAYWYFAEDPGLALSPRETVTVTRVSTGQNRCRLTVAAAALVKDLTLLVDRIQPHWRVDTGMVTLVAGDTHTFEIECAAAPQAAELAELTSPTVLRSANDLVCRPPHTPEGARAPQPAARRES